MFGGLDGGVKVEEGRKWPEVVGIRVRVGVVV